ncbi:MAG: SDR family NAD(P)-dependent oxidoreductase [Anaerolineaceae bacterium]|nr:MAG: SDR family NAD(P)-dependent oxidoreductase [Anaerolineaceae bacterium]
MPDALIWGASGGIGAALVVALKSDGWRVFAAARDELKIPAEADATFTFNAANPDDTASVISLCAQQTDGFDFVAYTAGGLVASPLDKLTATDWGAIFDANVTGAFVAAQASLPLMHKGAHMMIIGAYVEKITLPRMGAYAAAKAALEPMVRVLGRENRKMKFSLVRPPAVDTPFWENVPFKLPDYAIQPQAVASAMIAHFKAGESGTLDIESS